MLTVKVTKQAVDGDGKPVSGRFSTKVVEAHSVDIHILRPGELVEVAGQYDVGDARGFAFYIAPREGPRPEGFSAEVDFYFNAFIENSAGATTEIVRF